MVKIDNLLGGSVMDEFAKMALEKGWIVDNNVKEGAMAHSAESWAEFQRWLKENPDGQLRQQGYDAASGSMAGSVEPAEIGKIIQKQMQKDYYAWLEAPQFVSPGDESAGARTKEKGRVNSNYQHSAMIGQIQGILQVLAKKYPQQVTNPGKVDNSWGPTTAKSWNKVSQTVKGFDAVDPSGLKPPSNETMMWVVNTWTPKELAGRKQREKELDEMQKHGPKSVPGAEGLKGVTEHGEVVGPTSDHNKADDEFSKEAAMNLTPQQKTVVQRLMELRGLSFDDALGYAKTRYSRLFNPKPEPKPEPKIKLPTWMIEDPYERWAKEEPELKSETMRGLQEMPEIADEIAEKTRKEIMSPTRVVIPRDANDGFAIAAVVDELVSLANDLEKMGELEAATDVDKQIVLYKEAADKLYDITGETGDDLVNQAHPGGGPTIVPAQDEGGKVETLIEEHKKVVEKALKNPTGKYAEMMSKLVITANLLDDDGDIEAAQIVDKTIASLRNKLLDEGEDPFVNRGSANEAAGSEENNASLKKVSQVEDSTERLEDIINEMIKSLRGLESSVQDQTDEETAFVARRHDLLVVNPWSGDPEPDAEYDEFIMAAARQLASYLINSNTVAKQPNKLRRLQRDAQIIEKSLRKMKKYYRYVKAANESHSGKWDENAYGLWAEARNSLNTFISSVVPRKEDALKGREQSGKQAVSKNLANYRLALAKLKKALSNPDEKMLQMFGRGNLNEGAKRHTAVQQWIDKELKVFYSPAQAIIENRNLWNDLVHPLKNKKIIVWSVTKKNIVREGRSPVSFDPNKKAPGKKTPGKGRRGAPAKAKDPQVKALQEAMMAAGLSLPKFGADGSWGKETADAYNQMMAQIKTLVPRLNTPVATAEKPSSRVINLGQRVAVYLQKAAPAITGDIDFRGKKVSLKSLQSPQAFVAELRLQGLFDPNSEHDNVPAKLLQEMYGVIQPLKATMDLETPGKFNQIVSMMQKLYGELVDGWKQQTKSIPGTAKPGAPGTALPAGASGKPGAKELSKFPSLRMTAEQKAAIDDLRRKVNALPEYETIVNMDAFRALAKARGDETGVKYARKIQNMLGVILRDMEKHKAKFRATHRGEFEELYTKIVQYLSLLRVLREKLMTQITTPSPAPGGYRAR